jgi:hypothetical protein
LITELSVRCRVGLAAKGSSANPAGYYNAFLSRCKRNRR